MLLSARSAELHSAADGFQTWIHLRGRRVFACLARLLPCAIYLPLSRRLNKGAVLDLMMYRPAGSLRTLSEGSVGWRTLQRKVKVIVQPSCNRAKRCVVAVKVFDRAYRECTRG